MTPRKPLLPRPQRKLRSEFAHVTFPKANERASIATWASPGKSADGASVSGGTYRFHNIRRQLGSM